MYGHLPDSTSGSDSERTQGVDHRRSTFPSASCRGFLNFLLENVPNEYRVILPPLSPGDGKTNTCFLHSGLDNGECYSHAADRPYRSNTDRTVNNLQFRLDGYEVTALCDISANYSAFSLRSRLFALFMVEKAQLRWTPYKLTTPEMQRQQ